MDYIGKAQFTVVVESPPELEAEGDRIFAQHAAWMAKSHYREGDKALLQYNIAKSHSDNGNVIFIMLEVYETDAGIDDHIAQAQHDAHHDALVKWWEKCQVTFIRNATVVQSLW